MKKTTSKVFLLAATYSLFMSIGIAFIIMQLYSGSFAESFGLSMTELGTLLSCQFLASMITPLITGRLSDVIGKKKVLIGGIALFAIGCFVISLSKTAAICKIGIFLMGGGRTCTNGVCCAALVDVFPEKAPRYIALTSVTASSFNMLTSALASLLGPAFPDWRTTFALTGFIILIPLVFTCLSKIEKADKTLKAAQGFKGVFDALKKPNVIIVFFATGFASAMTMNYGSYVNSFFTEIFGAEKLGSSMVFVHSLCSVIGTSIFGMLKISEEVKIKYLAFASAFFLILESLMPSAVSAFIFGLFFSVLQATIFTLFTALMAKQDLENTGLMTSLVLIAHGAGSSLGAIAAGFMADILNLRGSYLLLSVCGLISGALLVLLHILYKKRKTGSL